MSKCAISVTLAEENLLWLRGQAHAAGARSVSAVLDGIVSAARTGGQVAQAAIRSVSGTVQISEADPDLLGADAAVRALFPAPLVADGESRYGRSKGRARRPAPRHETR